MHLTFCWIIWTKVEISPKNSHFPHSSILRTKLDLQPKTREGCFVYMALDLPMNVLSDEPSPRVHPCLLLVEPLPMGISLLCRLQIKDSHPYHTQPKGTAVWCAETSGHQPCSRFSEQLYRTSLLHLNQGRERERKENNVWLVSLRASRLIGEPRPNIYSAAHLVVQELRGQLLQLSTLIVRNPGWQAGVLPLTSSK